MTTVIDDKMLIEIDRSEFLKMIDLIAAVNLHRKERLITAKEQAWKLAKELRSVDYEEVTA